MNYVTSELMIMVPILICIHLKLIHIMKIYRKIQNKINFQVIISYIYKDNSNKYIF